MARFFRVCVGVSVLAAAGIVVVTQTSVGTAAYRAKGDRFVSIPAPPADCDRQSWPNISGVCLIQMRHAE